MRLIFIFVGFVFLMSCHVRPASKVGKVLASDYSLVGDGKTDDAEAFQAAINAAVKAHVKLVIPKGVYVVSKTLNIVGSIDIEGAGVGKSVISFRGVEGPLFYGKEIEGVKISHLSCFGRGNYSTAWTGSSNKKFERGLLLYSASEIVISDCEFKNFAKSGMTFFGAENCTIKNNIIEGTHILGSKLAVHDNYQFGIFVGVTKDDLLTDISILNNDISYTTQGIITSQGKYGSVAKSFLMEGNFVHDIIGQHGVYCSTSNTKINGNVFQDIGLEGIKVQASHGSIANIEIINNKVINCPNSQGINITEIHEGKNKIENVVLRNNLVKNCARGVNIYGKIINLTVDSLFVSNITKEYGLYIRGFEMSHVKFSNLFFNNPKKEAIYISNDKLSKNIHFAKVKIKSDTKISNEPIYIYSGSNIKFVETSCKQLKNMKTKIFSVSKKSKNIIVETEKDKAGQ